MRLLRRSIVVGAALLFTLPPLALVAAPAGAADAPYLTANQLDLTVLLPPPPTADSDQQAADLQAVIAVQKAASPERVKQAQADAQESVFDMFTVTLGERFAAANLPTASAFFDRVGDTEDAVADPVKKAVGRLRPWLASTDVKAIPPTSKTGSFPSGHTTRVTMCAIILDAMLAEKLLPEKRAAIWARAADYAHSRIVLGMHYPSDVEAGQRAGTAIAAVLFTDPAFRADFDAAKVEVRAALGM